MKQLFCIVMLVITCFTSVKSQPFGDVSFDPFGSPSHPVENLRQNDAGPVIPQVEFNNQEISMIFQIISDATGWSIFPTLEVSRSRVNFWAKNISALNLLDTVVAMSGFVYHRNGNVITVMTYDEYMQHHGLERNVIELNFASASSVESIIKPFMSRLGKIVVHSQTNTLIIYETEPNSNFLERVISKIDVPSEDIKVEVIRLDWVDSDNLASILQSIYTKQQTDIRNKSGNTKLDQINSDLYLNLPKNIVEIFSVPQNNQLVIVGHVEDIKRVKRTISTLDVFGENVVIEVLDLKYADAEVLAAKLQQLFSTDNQSKSRPLSVPEINVESMEIISPRADVTIQALGRSNQIVIRAYRADIRRIGLLVDKLDSYVEPMTQNYRFVYIDAEEIYDSILRILNLDHFGNQSRDSQDRNQGATLMAKTNSILVTGPPSAHRIMSSIIEEIDKPATYESGMIKIYKLENADVVEVATIISELLEASSKETDRGAEASFSARSPGRAPVDNAPDGFSESEGFVPQIQSRVSISPSTNSVIIQATAREHREFEKLIAELDKRRKQVMIEALIVELINIDDFFYGAELSHADNDFSLFTAFGLSTNLDPATGERDIIVQPGGTAAVLRPDRIQIILQALQQTGNARITSAPKILVNDNAVGFINSVAEEPFVTVNQGQVTTTTSFGGFVEAGVQFALQPHISENDYLRIAYSITLNTFGTKPQDITIPPPRNTSSIESEATVPEGYTIIVGGLKADDESERVDKVPILGDIPVLDLLFKRTTTKNQQKLTYLFITPHIMDEDDFSDLRNISADALGELNQRVGDRSN